MKKKQGEGLSAETGYIDYAGKKMGMWFFLFTEILFFGLYYVMTGLHGLHVLVGVVVISFMLYFTRKETINRENYARLENTGLYWHFVDIVWIYLYPLFYLIT